MNIFVFVKMIEICMEYNLGSGKQLSAIKVSFCINKPGFRGLMSELPSQKADLFMTSYL